LTTFGNFAKRKVADPVVAGKGVADDVAVEETAEKSLSAASEADAAGSTTGALPDDLVEVGFIVDAYGVKGWVKIQPHAQDGHGGDAMVRARKWWIAARLPVVGAPLRLIGVREAKMHSGSVVAHLAGFADRDQALAAKGTTVHVRRADFPKLAQDEFYWVDLIGLAVVNTEGEALGEVVGLIDNGAHSVMRIVPAHALAGQQNEGPSAEVGGEEVAGDARRGKAAQGAKGAKGREPAVSTDERLVPFVDAYVRSVDLEARRIVVDWGLDY
jgi:16S rRNA processing protein RimM